MMSHAIADAHADHKAGHGHGDGGGGHHGHAKQSFFH